MGINDWQRWTKGRAFLVPVEFFDVSSLLLLL